MMQTENEVPGEPGTCKVKVPAGCFLVEGDGMGCEEKGNEYYEYIYTILPDAPNLYFLETQVLIPFC